MTLSVTMVNSLCERVNQVENSDAHPIKSDRLATHYTERHPFLKLCMCICNKKGANNLTKVQLFEGHMVAQLVEALLHKP